MRRKLRTKKVPQPNKLMIENEYAVLYLTDGGKLVCVLIRV